jgi:hypothetical protein
MRWLLLKLLTSLEKSGGIRGQTGRFHCRLIGFPPLRKERAKMGHPSVGAVRAIHDYLRIVAAGETRGHTGRFLLSADLQEDLTRAEDDTEGSVFTASPATPNPPAESAMRLRSEFRWRFLG